ncbi:MAG: class I SAM-dependent methyltransferase [Sedimentisphaerales bacterium]|nr:class I SAM-dependent methyltransferase [Sedimentisphaerales bacterium]
MEWSPEFVLKVNEIYHDVEGDAYQDKHPEIFMDESIRWQRIGRQFIHDSDRAIHLLDVGSGTGFVPLQIAEYLKAHDVCVCSDISGTMLDVCRRQLERQNYRCECQFQKIEGNDTGLPSNSYSHITMNSVLHHIPDFQSFFEEIDRLLCVQGRLIIGHEPNKAFHTHKLLWFNSRLFYILTHSGAYMGYQLKKYGFYNKRFLSGRHACSGEDHVCREVNQRLMQAGVIRESLPAGQIGEIVDFHSPTAGGFHADRGIDIFQIQQEYLPHYKMEYYETYNHLGRISMQTRLARGYDTLLKKMFPRNGATFMVVLKKTDSRKDYI